ncbi:MAG: HAMP domain-containing sensor histidine kinase [Pseudomonadota bacterium]
MPPATTGPDSAAAGWRHGLSARLFAITIAAILLVELLIFIPSAANFRWNWLEERVQAARIAALALDAAPSRMVSEELSSELLASAEVLAVAEMEDATRMQLLAPRLPLDGEMAYIDIRDRRMFASMAGAIDSFFSDGSRTLVITAEGSTPDRVIEVVVPEAPLSEGLEAYCHRIVALSLIISLAAGALIYGLLVFMVVRPMRRITTSVEQFRDDPGSWTRRLEPTPRRDEIGRAQNALSDMERAVSDSFRQRDRLADLGEAVAKINHDLRNSLATVQLVSDTLTRSEDPRVQRGLPRMERAIERALKLAADTLQYGKAETPAAALAPLPLKAALDEAAFEALAAHPSVAFDNLIADGAQAQADPDHLHRICANLIRNAAQAMDGGGRVTVRYESGALDIADTGPGLPERARENLFKPFSASSRKDGTGLGLVIARDLARSMGGELTLAGSGAAGTTFRLQLQPVYEAAT